MSNVSERRTVHYSGNVQGVGFRFQAVAVAQQHAVAGFVQNLPDRRVLLVAEGLRPDVLGFLQAVQDRLGHHIRQQQVDVSAATGEFAGFVVRH